MRRSYLPLPRGTDQLVAGGARGFDLEDRRGSAFFLQAGVSEAADGVCRGGAEAFGRESRRQRRLRLFPNELCGWKPNNRDPSDRSYESRRVTRAAKTMGAVHRLPTHDTLLHFSSA